MKRMETTIMIKILIADDHAVLRSGLLLLINNQEDMEVIGEAGTGKEALEKVQALKPDILLLDINMPEMDGLSVIPEIRERVPECRILILTMHDDANYLQEALKEGASGYLLKQAADTELIRAIQAVMRGETYLHPTMTQKLVDNMLRKTQEIAIDPWRELSEREFDVMRLVAMGYTNQEIAEQIFLSVKTIETYRARGMEKLNLQTRAQLVKSALKYGHLDQEE
jgi:two-component system, NarL family, response regulator NreC